jgi:anthranilate phosphoribosyltransferase
MDLCGTGGDGKDTFNISTTTSFVVAGAGIRVAKHGNNGVSSVCGSSNVLTHLGIGFTNDEDTLRRCLEEAGICYLHAPLFHPAMKHVAPVRRALSMRTFFNMLGPLVNPSRPSCQLVGVYDLELARLYAYLLQRGEGHYTVVHSLDGYDEISMTGPVKLISSRGEEILEPAAFGLSQVTPSALYGGDDIPSAAAIFTRLLQGEGTPAQETAVLANAAVAIRTARPELSLSDAREMATESLRSGKAWQAFQTLVALTEHAT